MLCNRTSGFQASLPRKMESAVGRWEILNKSKRILKKTGAEERYLRLIAYREFTRLVHGYLGKRRIPLPACANTAIRKALPSKEDEPLTGFQLDED
ncbi:unnamed protein product [Porites lobata]|uniref:Uncharacterized protein n=1 Tax=Porites lobata TaxID=104759 RepID=A0ABN8MT84_9CNID|nr:unnamed protein product [Porites lobata]